MTQSEKQRRENCEKIVNELSRISSLPSFKLYGLAGRALKKYDLQFILSSLSSIHAGNLSQKESGRIFFGVLRNRDMKRIDVDIKIPHMGMEV